MTYLREIFLFLPESFAGLNLHAATRDFCFTREDDLYMIGMHFWAMLRHVENEEGFAKFTGVLPEEIAQAFIADAQADNAQRRTAGISRLYGLSRLE